MVNMILFVQCLTKLTNTFSQAQIYGYLNSIIIIIMVTAAINANDRLEVQTNRLKRKKKLEANRGSTKVPGLTLFCKNQITEYICVLSP